MVEYGFNFATFEPFDAKALHFLHDSLKRMWRAQEDKKEASEGELSTSSSEISGHEAIIPSTFPQSVLQHMRSGGGGEVQGSSAPTKNPANSLRSLFTSSPSGHSEDNSRQTEGSQAEEACHRELGDPAPLVVVERGRPHQPQLAGRQAQNLAELKKCWRKEPL